MIRVAEEERNHEVRDSWQRATFSAWLTTPTQASFREWLKTYHLLDDTQEVLDGLDVDNDRRKALRVVQSLLNPRTQLKEVGRG